eukprot:GDKK01010492.1.p1 GENE.GDKK01010492.1~~GDKK01010492.1.p1  ORF type:complete len:351 (-),score=36.72 GDKK01010492.1:80-1132(-)
MSTPGRPVSAIRQMQSAHIPDLLNELVLYLVSTKPEDPLTSLISFLEQRQSGKPVVEEKVAPENVAAVPIVEGEVAATETEQAAPTTIPELVQEETSAVASKSSNVEALPAPALKNNSFDEAAMSTSPNQTPHSTSSPVGMSPRNKMMRLRINADKSLLSQSEILGKEARRLIAAIETESTKQMSIMGINQKPPSPSPLASSMSASTNSPVMAPGTGATEPVGKKPLLSLGALGGISALNPSLMAATNNHRAILAALESLGRHNVEISAALRDIAEAATPEQVSPRKVAGQSNAVAISTLNEIEQEEDLLMELITNSGASEEQLTIAAAAHAKMLEAIASVRHYSTALCL